MTMQERRILDALDRKIDSNPSDMSAEMISLYQMLMKKYLQHIAASYIYGTPADVAPMGCALAPVQINR